MINMGHFVITAAGSSIFENDFISLDGAHYFEVMGINDAGLMLEKVGCRYERTGITDFVTAEKLDAVDLNSQRDDSFEGTLAENERAHTNAHRNEYV